MQVALAYQSKD